MHDDEGVVATIPVRVDKTTIYQLPTAIYISTLLHGHSLRWREGRKDLMRRDLKRRAVRAQMLHGGLKPCGGIGTSLGGIKPRLQLIRNRIGGEVLLKQFRHWGLKPAFLRDDVGQANVPYASYHATGKPRKDRRHRIDKHGRTPRKRRLQRRRAARHRRAMRLAEQLPRTAKANLDGRQIGGFTQNAPDLHLRSAIRGRDHDPKSRLASDCRTGIFRVASRQDRYRPKKPGQYPSYLANPRSRQQRHNPVPPRLAGHCRRTIGILKLNHPHKRMADELDLETGAVEQAWLEREEAQQL